MGLDEVVVEGNKGLGVRESEGNKCWLGPGFAG